MFQNQLGYRNSKRELGTEIESGITQGIHKYRSAVV